MNSKTIDGVLVSRELIERVTNPFGDVHDKFNAVQELRALLDSPIKQFDSKGWNIDYSAGRPILMHNNCSVIEAEQAYGLLELINSNTLRID